MTVWKRSEVLSELTHLPRSELGGKGLTFNALELEMGLNSVVEKGKVRSVHARCKAEVLRMALSFYGGQCGFGGERDFFLKISHPENVGWRIATIRIAIRQGAG